MNEVEEKVAKHQKALYSTEQAKKVLKEGDRIRVKPCRCHSKKVTITFSHFENDGQWIVSKSGGNEYHAMFIDMLNGKPVNFCD